MALSKGFSSPFFPSFSEGEGGMEERLEAMAGPPSFFFFFYAPAGAGDDKIELRFLIFHFFLTQKGRKDENGRS